MMVGNRKTQMGGATVMKSLARFLLVTGACGLIALGGALVGCDRGPKNVDKDAKVDELEVPVIEDDSDDEDVDAESAELSAPKN
jgi:hypothetical protein